MQRTEDTSQSGDSRHQGSKAHCNTLPTWSFVRPALFRKTTLRATVLPVSLSCARCTSAKPPCSQASNQYILICYTIRLGKFCFGTWLLVLIQGHTDSVAVGCSSPCLSGVACAACGHHGPLLAACCWCPPRQGASRWYTAGMQDGSPSPCGRVSRQQLMVAVARLKLQAHFAC